MLHFLRRSSVGILLCKSLQRIEVLEGGTALFHLLSPSNLRLLLMYIKKGVIGRKVSTLCVLSSNHMLSIIQRDSNQ